MDVTVYFPSEENSAPVDVMKRGKGDGPLEEEEAFLSRLHSEGGFGRSHGVRHPPRTGSPVSRDGCDGSYECLSKTMTAK